MLVREPAGPMRRRAEVGGGERRAKCTGAPRARREPARSSGTGSTLERPSARRARMAAVSTRTLLVLAAVTGLAILVAGAVQILLAR